jgi:hypothetical protein
MRWGKARKWESEHWKLEINEKRNYTKLRKQTAIERYKGKDTRGERYKGGQIQGKRYKERRGTPKERYKRERYKWKRYKGERYKREKIQE